MRCLSLVMVVLMTVPTTQNEAVPRFVVDETKPYVYIAFDHAGKRNPLGPGEGKQGFWLRFVNNCRVAVKVGAFETGTRDPGIGVFYDVVPLPASGFTGVSSPQGEPPPETPSSEHSASPTKPPEGYYAEVYSTTTVRPGESILFSVPSNHLSPNWYLRVRFTLAVSPNRIGDQPYSFVDFRWEQLPKDLRGQKR